jgi:hypothetical protein
MVYGDGTIVTLEGSATPGVSGYYRVNGGSAIGILSTRPGSFRFLFLGFDSVGELDSSDYGSPIDAVGQQEMAAAQRIRSIAPRPVEHPRSGSGCVDLPYCGPCWSWTFESLQCARSTAANGGRFLPIARPLDPTPPIRRISASNRLTESIMICTDVGVVSATFATIATYPQKPKSTGATSDDSGNRVGIIGFILGASLAAHRAPPQARS